MLNEIDAAVLAFIPSWNANLHHSGDRAGFRSRVAEIRSKGRDGIHLVQTGSS
jgi:hypothetical protein